jgi:hypothetical protein
MIPVFYKESRICSVFYSTRYFKVLRPLFVTIIIIVYFVTSLGSSAFFIENKFTEVYFSKKGGIPGESSGSPGSFPRRTRQFFLARPAVWSGKPGFVCRTVSHFFEKCSSL